MNQGNSELRPLHASGLALAPSPAGADEPISVLVVSPWGDRPEAETFIGLAASGCRGLLQGPLVRRRLPPEKLVTIHKGHDLAWYTEPPADLSQHGIPPGAFVIGCIANWRPRKGLEVLLEAFRRLPAELPIHLLLVGHMDSRRLTRAVATHERAARIHNLGYQPEATRLIAACDLSVLATVKREGLPKTVIEAMASGIAPIVTACGGSPELVIDGESGLVVPPGDAGALLQAILRLYRDPELRAHLARGARRRIAQEFNIARSVDKMLALYRELLGRA